jgi:hypothetical protein
VVQLFYSIAAMNALFSSMAWCAAKPNRWSILAVLTFALMWPFVNGDLQGDVLLQIDSTSAITVSDLLSILAGVIALIQAMRIHPSARRNQSASSTTPITGKLLSDAPPGESGYKFSAGTCLVADTNV